MRRGAPGPHAASAPRPAAEARGGSRACGQMSELGPSAAPTTPQDD